MGGMASAYCCKGDAKNQEADMKVINPNQSVQQVSARGKISRKNSSSNNLPPEKIN
jgi:hypothetical protein